MEITVSPADRTESLVHRMFYLAWKSCGGPTGMGVFQDRGGDVSEDLVMTNIIGRGDYPGRPREPSNEPYADYIFGRMMKMSLKYSHGKVSWSDRELTSDYQSWCRSYSTYEALAKCAAAELGIEIGVAALAGEA